MSIQGHKVYGDATFHKAANIFRVVMNFVGIVSSAIPTQTVRNKEAHTGNWLSDWRFSGSG